MKELDNTVYCTIDEAAKRSGLSRYFWRTMVREKKVPHILSGTKYMINYPAAMRVLSVMAGATEEVVSP